VWILHGLVVLYTVLSFRGYVIPACHILSIAVFRRNRLGEERIADLGGDA
jgi:hypothetical protein